MPKSEPDKSEPDTFALVQFVPSKLVFAKFKLLRSRYLKSPVSNASSTAGSTLSEEAVHPDRIDRTTTIAITDLPNSILTRPAICALNMFIERILMKTYYLNHELCQHSLECAFTGEIVEKGIPHTTLSSNGKPLLVKYDLEKIKKGLKEMI